MVYILPASPLGTGGQESIKPTSDPKTKAMDLYQNGIPLPIIMRILGHENASTTQAFYAFATLEMMRKAIDTATPVTTHPMTDRLTADTLNALYSLR